MVPILCSRRNAPKSSLVCVSFSTIGNKCPECTWSYDGMPCISISGTSLNASLYLAIIARLFSFIPSTSDSWWQPITACISDMLNLKPGIATSYAWLPFFENLSHIERSMPWNLNNSIKCFKSLLSSSKTMHPPSPVVIFLIGWKLNTWISPNVPIFLPL